MPQDPAIIAYLRLSRDEEKERGVSMEDKIALRRDILLTIAKHHNIDLAPSQVVVELASGGSLNERPEILALLERCRRKEVHTVIAFDVDRLTRDVADLKTISNAFFKGEVRLITQRGTYHFNEHFDTTLLQILAVLGEKERRSFSYRRKAANEQRARSGKLSQGYAPYGYRWDKELACYVTHPAEYPIVEEIFQRIRRVGCYSVAQELSERGITPPGEGKAAHASSKWLKGSIGNIIRNPFYTGYLVKTKSVDREGNSVQQPSARWIWSEEPLVTRVEGETVPLPHPITVEEWEALQEAVHERRKAPPTKGLLTGLLYCVKGGKMHRHYKFYSCGCAETGEPHRLHTVMRHLVEPAVWRGVAAFMESLPTQSLKPPKKRVQDDSAKAVMEKRTAERELREKRSTLEELVGRASFYLQLPHYGTRDKNGKSLYDKTLETLGVDIQKLQAKIETLSAKLERPEIRLSAPLLRQIETLGGMEAFIASASVEAQHDLLRLLVKRISIPSPDSDRQQIQWLDVVFYAPEGERTERVEIAHSRLGKPRGTYKHKD